MASTLAQHWLSPFQKAGISADDLAAASPVSRLAEARLCPLIQVLNNRIYIVADTRMRQLDMQLHRCDSGAVDGDFNENFCPEAMRGKPCRRQQRSWERRRLQVVLRLLHIAVSRQSLPDFEMRVCVDDTCHGVWEKPRRPRPLFTMAACDDAPTLPMVQWNAEGPGRDPDLAVWDEMLQKRVAMGRNRVEAEAWACRAATAVFRGSANQLHTYNNDWSRSGHTRRVRTTHTNFNASGRWALVSRKLQSPNLLDVRLSVLRRGESILGEQYDPALFKRRVDAVSSDEPAHMSIVDQAERFKYILHIEGHGGWADRLKHLLPLGVAVLKQDSGVREWFEPLMVPGFHFMTVQSDLTNLTAAAGWAKLNDRLSRSTAIRALNLAERLLPLPVITEYATALFQGYARLMRFVPKRHESAVHYRCWPATVNRSLDGCADHPLSGRQLTDCALVDESVEDAESGPPRRTFATLRAATSSFRGTPFSARGSLPPHDSITRREGDAKQSRPLGRPCITPGTVDAYK
jgi:hypothetical protein